MAGKEAFSRESGRVATWPYYLFAVAAGAMLPIQFGINAQLASWVGARCAPRSSPSPSGAVLLVATLSSPAAGPGRRGSAKRPGGSGSAAASAPSTCSARRHGAEARRGRALRLHPRRPGGRIARGRPLRLGRLRREPDHARPAARAWRSSPPASRPSASSSGRRGRPGERLRRQAVERLDGELEVLGLRVLELRVAEAAEALDEEHHGRHAGARDLGGVVQRAAREPVRRARDLADRLVGEADQRLVEEDRLDLPDPLVLDLDVLLLARSARTPRAPAPTSRRASPRRGGACRAAARRSRRPR